MRTLSSRSKALAAVAAVVVIGGGVAIASALRSDDNAAPPAATAPVSNSTTIVGATPAAPTSIGETPGSVATGATGGPAGGPVAPDLVNRKLDAAGQFTCSAPGSWRPFAGVSAVLMIGEPVPPATCGPDVLSVPVGFCSAQPCDSVPIEWEIRLSAGIAAQDLFLLVVPIQPPDALFYCVKQGVVSPSQELDHTVPIDEACPLSASPPLLPQPQDTVDIPYVPPVSLDIPSAPPPASVDIVSG